MYSVEEFIGGCCFGGLRLLGVGHFAGSLYTRCCLALTSSESHQSKSNRLGLGLQKLRELLNSNIQIEISNETLSVKGDDS